jgi:hypothetical protein
MALMCLLHRVPQILRRAGLRLGPLGVAQRLVGLQREFRVDHDGPRRVGQVDQAIGALAVRERRLEGIGCRPAGPWPRYRSAGFRRRRRASACSTGCPEATAHRPTASRSWPAPCRSVRASAATRPADAPVRGRGAVQRLGHAFLHLLQPPFHRLQHRACARACMSETWLSPPASRSCPWPRPCTVWPRAPMCCDSGSIARAERLAARSAEIDRISSRGDGRAPTAPRRRCVRVGERRG